MKLNITLYLGTKMFIIFPSSDFSIVSAANPYKKYLRMIRIILLKVLTWKSLNPFLILFLLFLAPPSDPKLQMILSANWRKSSTSGGYRRLKQK
jgi:hypothetical protein